MSNNPKKTHKVMCEAYKVLFRVAGIKVKGVYDRNYESDLYRNREGKALAGLISVLDVMNR